jgi:hypothetical protein
MGTMSILLPHPLFIVSCIAAIGVGIIIRWVLEQAGFDPEEGIRRLFGRR